MRRKLGFAQEVEMGFEQTVLRPPVTVVEADEEVPLPSG